MLARILDLVHLECLRMVRFVESSKYAQFFISKLPGAQEYFDKYGADITHLGKIGKSSGEIDNASI